MPPVVAAVVAAAGAFVFIKGVTLLTIAAVALSAYSVASAIGQKIPTVPSYSQQIRDRKIMVRSPNQTRTIVYGEAKISGPLIFASVSGDDNEFLHLVIPLASHEVNQIGDVYFNDKLSSFYDQFAVTQQDKIYYKAGGSDYKATINGTPYTEATVTALVSTLDGISGISADLETVFGGVGQQQTEKVVLTGDTASDVIIITATTYINDDSELTAARVEKVRAIYEPYRISKHLGTDSQAADSDLVSEVSEWTTAHQLKGIAYIYVRLWWKADVWLTGIPNISAVVQGKKVFDYRDSSTAYSNNWALCIADYLTSSDGFGAAAAEIDSASVIAAANASDEQVLLTQAPETHQNRYELNGVVRLDVSPRKNLDAMIGAGAGTVTYTQGVFKLYAGVYTSPVKTLTIDDLAGPIKVRAKASRADSFNAVKGTFSDPTQFYEPVDFPPVTNSFYETQDGGERIYADIELGYTTNSTRAQRIGKIMLEKSRQGITLDFPANLSALELAVNDTVRVSVSLLGWGDATISRILMESGDNLLMESDDKLLMEIAAGKQFKIVQWALSSKGGVDMILAEEASGIYDWNMGNETITDLAPNTNLPNPFFVAAPTNLTIVSIDQSLTHEDGTITERLKVTWNAPVSDAIARYEIQFKRTDEVVWQTTGFIEVNQTLEFFISPVIKDIAYDIQVRTISTPGANSLWTIVSAHLVDANRNVTLATFAASNWTQRTSSFGTDQILAAAHDGSGLWVIVGIAGKLATSPDGITWTQRTSGFGINVIHAVAHDSSGLWVIVGNAGLLATSPDGITWTLRTSSFGTDPILIVAHDSSGLWVAAGSFGNLATSPDGITWTQRTSGFGADDITAVAHDSSGLWVIAGEAGKLATSPDGITWTLRTSSFGADQILTVAHDSSDLWVAAGGAGKLATSPDGITWTQRTSGFGSSGITAVAYGLASGLWVAIAFSDKLATSSDGITWTQRTPGLAGDSVHGLSNNGVSLWVATGDSGKLITSLFN